VECNNEYRSTPLQFKEFVEGLVWQDILQELQNWENRIMQELAAPTFDPNTGQMVMGKSERVLYDEMLRGSLKAVDNMRMIPVIIIEILEQQQATKEQKDGDGTGSDFDFSDE
jgi:hypothetical protein